MRRARAAGAGCCRRSWRRCCCPQRPAARLPRARRDSGVGRWVRGVLGVGERDARPVLGRLPGGGRLLVQAGGSAWVVASDGAKRRLGAYDGTSWSPNGLFVVGWSGLELDGARTERPRAVVARAARVRAFRPLGSDRRLSHRVHRRRHAANRQRRRLRRSGLRRGVAGVAPAWRPDDRHVLAYVIARARERCRRRLRPRLWRSGPLPDVRALAWSPSGHRLLVVTRRRLVLLDRRGRRLASRAIAAGASVTGSEWSPRGREIAVVRHRAGVGRGRARRSSTQRAG